MWKSDNEFLTLSHGWFPLLQSNVSLETLQRLTYPNNMYGKQSNVLHLQCTCILMASKHVLCKQLSTKDEIGEIRKWEYICMTELRQYQIICILQVWNDKGSHWMYTTCNDRPIHINDRTVRTTACVDSKLQFVGLSLLTDLHVSTPHLLIRTETTQTKQDVRI